MWVSKTLPLESTFTECDVLMILSPLSERRPPQLGLYLRALALSRIRLSHGATAASVSCTQQGKFHQESIQENYIAVLFCAGKLRARDGLLP